jgi:arabinose-5-phosphate isomerase
LETNKEIIALASGTILTEAETIRELAACIDEQFAEVVRMIFTSRGRLIVTGIGKSAIIAQKIVATFNSTGTPAIFMHAADAIHGDLGIILPDDLVLCLSKSGNTPEIKVLVPIIRAKGNPVIAMVSNTSSYLATHADKVIFAKADKEACPNNLAPTSSTTAQLVMGDALAVCLLRMRGFTTEDFARVHPGGSLGKKLYTRVSDIARTENPPRVAPESPLKEVIMEISSKRMGAAAVVNADGTVAGVITDGDLRRMLEKDTDTGKTIASEIMTKNPKTISSDEMAVAAFYLMEKYKITQLVVSSDGRYEGMIHLHDILREGIV